MKNSVEKIHTVFNRTSTFQKNKPPPIFIPKPVKAVFPTRIHEQISPLDKPAPKDTLKDFQHEEVCVSHQLSKTQFIIVFIGLALGVFLGALDQTIVSVVLIPLSEEFGRLNDVVWVGTAYLLTSTALIPIYGKLADIFDRKPTFLFSIIVFEMGSFLCGMSSSMTMLIVSRAIQGIGGAGIFSLVIIIISDLVPLRDRPNYQGIIGAIFGIASVVGPLLGGMLLELPAQPKQSKLQAMKQVDWVGSLLLIVGVVLILIPLNTGGTHSDWNSAPIITMFVGGMIAIILFVLSQIYVAKEPIVPMSIWCNRHTIPVFITSFLTGMIFFCLVFYTPFYFQVVNGDSATTSGFKILPLILGVIILSLITGAITSSTGIYMPMIVFGAILLTTGSALLSTLGRNSSQSQQIGYLILVGAGIGCCLQSILIAAQASAEKMLSIAISNSNFMQSLGAVMGLAISGSLFNQSFSAKLDASLRGVRLPSSANLVLLKSNPSSVRSVLIGGLEPLQKPFISSFLYALNLVFLITVVYGGLLILASLFIKREKIPESIRKTPPLPI